MHHNVLEGNSLRLRPHEAKWQAIRQEVERIVPHGQDTMKQRIDAMRITPEQKTMLKKIWDDVNPQVHGHDHPDSDLTVARAHEAWLLRNFPRPK